MDQTIASLRGVGPARVKALQAAGIDTVRRLLSILPVDYRDCTQTVAVDALAPGHACAVSLALTGGIETRYVGRLHITRVRGYDETGSVWLVWYNQPWLKQTLVHADQLLLYGRVEAGRAGLQITCPTIEREGEISPVYKPIAGIPAGAYRKIVVSALDACDAPFPDALPSALRAEHDLCDFDFALRSAHRPGDRLSLQRARRRLAFEDLLFYQLATLAMRGAGRRGVAIPCAAADERHFWEALGFQPTGAQRAVLSQIARDLSGDRAMARLVQGDVGCGKTAVAFGALYLAGKAGYQGALMAPTEVLARQHYESAAPLFEQLGLRAGLLTGSLTAKAKSAAHEAIRSGAWRVIIGTHALISQGVTYERLGLVITDEQHRFGVSQRAALSQKGESANVLVMSATPIPRTLALILFGDLDVSTIDELPPGRTPVATRLVPKAKTEAMYGFIRDEVAKGRQAYIVCPLVEESEAVDAQPAEQLYEALTAGAFADLRVGLAHGRMKSDALADALDRFHRGEIDVLVATTVVEVGVNVPNASVMVIENAERFGLAQLHQLRGRVGRGAAKSWCFLMAEQGAKAKLLVQTNDGFVIAQKDLETRGAGELFGQRQSGASAPGLSPMACDALLLQETNDAARRILQRGDDPDCRALLDTARERFDDRMRTISFS